MKKSTKIFSLIMALTMVCSFAFTLVACGDTQKYYNNEEDPLVFSTLELDKVFNPFFSTSGTDSNVVGMTQISMLANDKDGNPVWGDNEAVVAKDVQWVTEGEKDNNQTTTYYFVLKNNVKFSNGSPLTIKDVLFNLYVYLDPVYTGSSTIYSTDIVGLKEYRTQSADADEQEAYDTKYKIAAQARIDALLEVAAEIIKEHSEVSESEMYDAAANTGYLKDYLDNIHVASPSVTVYDNILSDYVRTQKLFKEELQSDYNNCRDSYKEQLFTDKDGKVYKDLFTTDVEMFLFNEGYITWNKNEGKLYSAFVTAEEDWADLRSWTEEEAIKLVYEAKMPTALEDILQYWGTSVTLYDELVNDEIGKDAGSLSIPNISGITFANFSEPVVVNGKTYAVPEYETVTDDDGKTWQRPKDGSNEVLAIKIHNVDPKAIWNFAFAVAPMYYYSDAEHIAAFDYATNHFGVDPRNPDFMTDVVKNSARIGVPVGAGPYAASKASGGLKNVSSGDFYDKGVIYFERNPHYIMGPAKIKKIRFQVVSSNSMLDALYTNSVNFAEPNAKPETTQELDNKKSIGLDYKRITTLGYGYIGVNAGKVPNVYVRRAIMYAIDTSMTVSYYKNLAQPIYRSMSRNSWAYPTDSVAYYPYIGGPVPGDLSKVDPDYADYVRDKGYATGYTMTQQEQIEFLKWLMEDKAKYKLDANGLYADNGKNECKFEFTIAGQETDHPAYGAMYKASELLNKVGFNITVRTDKDALKKLSTGSLTVWAAAWGSTIDPDMYQVYHKDSTATSVLNWGYKQIFLNPTKYAYEVGRIEYLSELIEAARSTTVQDERKQTYSEALDVVMELAVELPTYQRNDLYAYNANMIDATTFYQEANAIKGLTTDIHTLSLIVEK